MLEWIGSLSDNEHRAVMFIAHLITGLFVAYIDYRLAKSTTLIPNSIWGLLKRIFKREPIKVRDENNLPHN